MKKSQKSLILPTASGREIITLFYRSASKNIASVIGLQKMVVKPVRSNYMITTTIQMRPKILSNFIPIWFSAYSLKWKVERVFNEIFGT
jgi:hypothetical protein